MTGQYLKKLAGLGLGCAMAIGAASAANATLVLNSYSMVSGRSETGTVHNASNPSINENAGIGEINLNMKDTAPGSTAFTWQSFCVDIKHNLVGGNGDLWTVSGSEGISDLMSALTLDSNRATMLYKLLYTAESYMTTDASGTGTSSDRGAGVQMAIWEIMNENGTTGFDAGSGTFKVDGLPVDSGTNPGYSMAISDANSLIQLVQNSSILNAGNFTVKLVSASGNQTQVIFSNGGALGLTTAVPEPATWGLMVIGFGAIGGALRRKSKPAGVIA